MRSDGGSAWLLARVPGPHGRGHQRAPGRRAVCAPNASSTELGGRTLTVQGLAWKDASWSWRPHAGAWIGLTLIEPRITRATVAATSPAQAPLGAGPAAPTTLRLPLALTLQGARIDALQIDSLAPLLDISVDAALGARDGAVHRLDQLAFTWDRASVHASGTLASDAPFELDLQSRAAFARHARRRGNALAGPRNGARSVGCAGGAGRARQRARCGAARRRQPAALCRLAGGVAGGDDPGPRPRQAGQRPADDALDGPRRHRLARPGRADCGAHRVAQLAARPLGPATPADRRRSNSSSAATRATVRA